MSVLNWYGVKTANGGIGKNTIVPSVIHMDGSISQPTIAVMEKGKRNEYRQMGL